MSSFITVQAIPYRKADRKREEEEGKEGKGRKGE